MQWWTLPCLSLESDEEAEFARLPPATADDSVARDDDWADKIKTSHATTAAVSSCDSRMMVCCDSRMMVCCARRTKIYTKRWKRHCVTHSSTRCERGTLFTAGRRSRRAPESAKVERAVDGLAAGVWKQCRKYIFSKRVQSAGTEIVLHKRGVCDCRVLSKEKVYKRHLVDRTVANRLGHV